MARAQTYTLRGHFEKGDRIQLDKPVENPPEGSVQVTVRVTPEAEPRGRTAKKPLSKEAQSRLEAFRRAQAMPITEEDKQFWEELGSQVRELRRQGTSRDEDI